MASVEDLVVLRDAVLEYLSEIDNPAPDATMRRILRDRLRVLVGAPAPPAPRQMRHQHKAR